MSKVKDNPLRSRERLYDEWVANDGRCTGTRTNGKPCRAICDQVELSWFCPGLSDRCYYHRDEMILRARDIALIAARSGAAPVEALQPPERKKARRPGKAKRPPEPPPSSHQASPPVEPTCRGPNGATGRQGGQLTFPFAASLAARLEPGPKATKSTAVDAARKK